MLIEELIYYHAKLRFDSSEALDDAISRLRDEGFIDIKNRLYFEGGFFDVGSDDSQPCQYKTIANKASPCITNNGRVLNIWPGMYDGLYIYNLTKIARDGFYHVAGLDDAYFTVWHNGRSITANNATEVVAYLEDPTPVELDSLLLYEDDFVKKHGVGDDHYELRNDVFYLAFANAQKCFTDALFASKFIKDKFLKEIIIHEQKSIDV